MSITKGMASSFTPRYYFYGMPIGCSLLGLTADAHCCCCCCLLLVLTAAAAAAAAAVSAAVVLTDVMVLADVVAV
jgi:hypothetical protein